MKNPDQLYNLITGNMAPEQKQAIYSEIKKDENPKNLFKKAKMIWALMSSSRKAPDHKIEASYRNIHERIFSRRMIFSIPGYLKYAAILILLIGLPALTFYLGRQSNTGFDPAIRNTSVVAERGQISKVILPDSSVVWLNSGTVLTYDHDYGYKNRDLQVEGEAYVTAAKNKDLPMMVASGDLRVKVLGTRFNVNGYPEEESIKVILEAGQVELLNSSVKKFRYQMEPGQVAKFIRRTGEVLIRDVRAQNYTNWKNGELIFVETPMDEVIMRLERKFDIETEIKNPDIYKSVFTANFKTESLEEILDYVRYSCPFTCQITKGNGKTRVIFK